MKKYQFITLFMSCGAFCSGFAQDTWSQKSNFGGTHRSEAVAFSIGNKGYLGTGLDSMEAKSDFWEYDPQADAWTQIADFGGGARRLAVGFVLNGKGYVGTGSGITEMKDLWEYDPSSNVWSQRAYLPGVGRSDAIGFSIGNKGYVGLGEQIAASKKDFYEYDPATDTWTQKADYPSATAGAVGFAIGSKGYVGTGEFTRKFRQYDPTTNTWINKANFPGLARSWAVGFAIGGKGYIGTGMDLFGIATNDFYEYDTLTDSWKQVSDFTGGLRFRGAGFAIGNKGYLGTGTDTVFGDGYNDFWEYTPEADCAVPSGLSTGNITATTATLSWNEVATATKYNIRYKRDSIGAQWISKSVAAPSTSKTITGLLPNSKYRWKVKTDCGSVKSEFSPTVKFTTLPLKTGHPLTGRTALLVHPNPLKSAATITWELAEDSHTTITLFDFSGRKLRTLTEATLAAGVYTAAFHKEDLHAGLYFLELKTSGETVVLKMIVQ